MLNIKIPGYNEFNFKELVLDFNGTLAHSGILIKGVAERLRELSRDLDIIVVTADTFGTVSAQLKEINCRIEIINGISQERSKLDIVKELGSDSVIAIGNGRNDQLMLKRSALGICIVGTEGAYAGSLLNSDIIYSSILDALDILLNTDKLIATLRN